VRDHVSWLTGAKKRAGSASKRGRLARLVTVAAVTALGPATVFLAVAAAPAATAGLLLHAAGPAASAGTVPPAPSGWTTAFSDDFSGSAGSGVDSNWTYDQGTQYSGTGCTGNWGTGEVETDTDSTANVSEDGNGHLDITPVDNDGSWTSGRIETVADDFEAPAGGEMEVSASIEQPNPSSGLGYWPAFWMLGAGFRSSGAGTSGTMDCSGWPSIGEIDIMEDVNALSEVAGTLHCGVDPGGPCDETNGLSSGLVSCPGCQTGYNTYSAIINRTNTSDESITYYLNGNAYYTVTESQVGTSTWQAAVDHGFFLILDVAMGGGYPNGVCGCTSPSSSTSSGAAMSVSYVAVYTTTGSGGDQPFGGTPAAVPGTVYAANYDTGGQGVAYNATSVNGTANSYRSDGIDLQDTADTEDTTAPGGAYNLGWTATGQWFNYTVDAASAGTYTVSLRLASPDGVTDALHIANSAGTSLSGAVGAPDTGGWQDWTTVTATVTLPAGEQTLTIDQDNPGWNIHFLAFAAASNGGGGNCSTTATSYISADCYSASQGTITVEPATGDTNPSGVDGNQVAQLVNGDWLEYPGIDFGSGSSQFDARVASGAAGGVSGLVEVVLDNPGNAPVGSFAVGNTGGWASWELIPANITTVTGTHNVYLEFVSGASGDPPFVSLHYFDFPAT
jgi:hypothetical protein